MAVVVIKWFFRSKKTAKERLSYIAGRPGKEKEDMSRPLFGFGGQMSREQAERMIANAPKGTIFFPIILSPDPTRENTEKDLDLWHVTRQTFVVLERRLHLEGNIQFIAAEHNDHTEIAHIHSIALIKGGRIGKEELRLLRQAATQEALLQRHARDVVRDHAHVHTLRRQKSPVAIPKHAVEGRRRGRGVGPVRTQGGCLQCGYGNLTGIPRSYVFCPNCHKRLKRERSAGITLAV
jgi:hypothetical protein